MSSIRERPVQARREHRLTCAVLLAALGIVASGASASAEQSKGGKNHVIEFIVKTEEKGGHVLCGLFRESGWLEDAVLPSKSAVSQRRAVCRFSGMKPGVYAISAFHDENDNGELDKNFLGIPTEDWCTSRNAPARFGPPDFDDAKFSYRGGELTLRARM